MLEARDNADLDRLLRNFRIAEYPIYTVYFIVSLIFALTLSNIVYVLYTYLVVRHGSQRESSVTTGRKDEESGSSPMTRRKISLKRAPLALLNFLRIVTCRLSFWMFWDLKLPLIEIFACLGNLALMLAFTFVNCMSRIFFH